MTELLIKLRELRNFDPDNYIDLKTKQINEFFKINNLDSVILGISGGIDSATTLALLMRSANIVGSPIKKVVAISMPIFCSGTTGQVDAINIALDDIEKYKSDKKFKIQVDDLSKAHSAFLEQRKGESTPFSSGQLASIVRTPHLYFNAAILQTEGYKSLVCGTTNRDESYLIGFYGKASDAMVDLQPIFDIHKSEVYQIAKKMNVSNEIVERQPMGDVFDGKTDIEMIGASYDSIELAAHINEYHLFINDNVYLSELRNTFTESAEYKNIFKLHHINSHKYKVGLPFHILSVFKQHDRWEDFNQ
jgi:NAD+ synthetase